MITINKEYLSNSPSVETILHGGTTEAGSTIRPAETHWHMVIVRAAGETQLRIVGAWPSAGIATWGADAEIVWIKFRLGTYMPHLPVKNFVDGETPLPGASSRAFWLKGSAWQFPQFDEVETFIERLVRQEILVRDPVVSAVLQDQPVSAAERTVRHRFLQTTGLTQSQIRQIERAQQAAALLRNGVSILDTVFELDYFDQPHLTRAMKQWVGHTPAEYVRLYTDPCHSVQDALSAPAYTEVVVLGR